MNTTKKTTPDFVQDPTYAAHFDNYRSLLSKTLNHNPAMFQIDKSALIVDVGCGFGDMLKELRARGYKNILGVEPDDLCRESCLKDGLDVRTGTITKTGLPNNTADVIIVNQVFHHMCNYQDAIDELSRILESGGLLCFLEPSPTFLRLAMDIVTFHTPLPKLFRFVQTRYDVMKLEMETGLYPKFLHDQVAFHAALNSRFTPIWHKQGCFFQFGKYKKK